MQGFAFVTVAATAFDSDIFVIVFVHGFRVAIELIDEFLILWADISSWEFSV
jgi:hypothetical protein